MIEEKGSFQIQGIFIPYLLYRQMIGDIEKVRYYVIDLTDSCILEKIKQVTLLMYHNFLDFQNQILWMLYYENRENIVGLNLNFVFKIPDNMNINHDMYLIANDFNYARKLFVPSSLFKKLICANNPKDLITPIEITGDEYFLRNFNVLADSEPIKNLEFLKSLSQKLKTPIRNISSPSYTEVEEMLKTVDRKKLCYYYQKLWSMFQEEEVPENLNRLSSTEEKMFFLVAILSSQKDDEVLLLNNLGWKTTDDNRKLNLISTLSDFSEQVGSIVLTCENRNVTKLIKKKVYNPNFYYFLP